jgi:ubiquinone/menaquinone biosynthesis C-methylase UbiE
MTNEIKLLSANLLNDEIKLSEILYWHRVMNRPNGWHYDLDQIWILNELEKFGILPGATIVDAGAGQGVMQYMLAARGYNVISLDFSPRTRPSRSIGIFKIFGEGDADITYQHPYMKFISYGGSARLSLTGKLKFENLKKIPLLPKRIFRRLRSVSFYMYERFVKNHDSYGKITYLRAPFHEVPMESSCVDAVISISAIEHADIKLFHENIKELTRLLRPAAPFLLTTSATIEKENTYHEKTSGWCFSLASLKKFFPECKVEFDSDSCVKSLIESEVFKGRLDPYYYECLNSLFFKKCIVELPYLPVAVRIIK